MGVARLVDVGSTHRDCPDFEQHLAVANLGNWNLAQLDRERLERVVDDGLLGHG
jgi:hypothetical protein